MTDLLSFLSKTQNKEINKMLKMLSTSKLLKKSMIFSQGSLDGNYLLELLTKITVNLFLKKEKLYSFYHFN